MLEGNRRRVQNLSGGEIWMFIIARVLIGFAAGVLATLYFPAVASYLAWPAFVAGVLLFVLASKGLLRSRRPN
ncbi:hypothetical protein ACFFJT_00455 [Dyella flava]|uniref:Integron gene cassette protein n=1 Tax=Dyella flava TaxID=1920170 RepID=A0ABS2K0T2_9GAMM|nr:hypothetical protein [Dyella flava]MBM7124210.1 hypothetical protein [Dyella flava]